MHKIYGGETMAKANIIIKSNWDQLTKDHQEYLCRIYSQILIKFFQDKIYKERELKKTT